MTPHLTKEIIKLITVNNQLLKLMLFIVDQIDNDGISVAR